MMCLMYCIDKLPANPQIIEEDSKEVFAMQARRLLASAHAGPQQQIMLTDTVLSYAVEAGQELYNTTQY